ncbi:MAG TPA: ROK family transcriptional regulator [Clostridiales bacterium]|nr:ROK family transcriptional regulator [Clostridiales bacterium]
MENINNRDKKNTNKINISKFILYKGETNKLEIATGLGISMPTVLQNVKDLMKDGIVAEIGSYQSTGGRKAKAISIIGTTRYSVGIDITREHISFVLLNLKGELIKTNRIRKGFENSLDYNEALKQELNEFISSAEIDEEKILGVGIALPGIIDQENEILIKSHILQLGNISLKNLSQILPYQVRYENDANSAARAELNFADRNAIYLSLSNTVGGAVYFNNSIYKGDNYRSAEFGHMVIVPEGKQCYCGKKGCVDAYCSAKVLSGYSDDNLEEFFRLLEEKDEGALAIWEQYLEYLAITVTNLRMAFDCDIVLGGYIGRYVSKYMPQLGRKVLEYNLFENDTTYLKPCKYQREASAMGIAMSFIEMFFETL